MDSFLKDIDIILSNCNDKINEKLYGINYLEHFKYYLIDELKQVFKDSVKETGDFETTKKYGKNNLTIKINYHQESLSKIKYILTKNTLSIVLKGSKTVKFFNTSKLKNDHTVTLYNNMGISISSDTLISESIKKDTILMDIININDNIEK